MYDLLKSLVALLIMPLPLTLLALSLALFLLWLGRRRLAIVLASTSITVLLLLSWAPVAERLLAPLETTYPTLDIKALDSGVDAIVVLGGGWFPDRAASDVGRMGNSSAIRILEGVHLWHQVDSVPLIVTGASRSRPDSTPIAQGYATLARSLQVPESAIVVLDQPTDTAQEAAAVRDHLGPDARVILVTSASHMPRSMQYFQQAGLDPVAAPTHYLTGGTSPGQLAHWVPSAQNLRKSERAIYEYLGLIAASLGSR